MKRRIKMFLLALSVSGPVVTNFSCSTAVGTPLRDAAVEGAAGVIREAVATWLALALDPTAIDE